MSSRLNVRERRGCRADAGGQRFLATGEFLWMEEIAGILQAKLGPRASKVPTRRLPDALFRFAAGVLGFAPRPADATLYDCAVSLS